MRKRNSKACPTPQTKTPAVRSSVVDSESHTISANEIARNVLNPSILAANTITAVLPTETPLDVQALATALGEQAGKANDGDLSRAESMLMAQAHTLNAIFTTLTRRGIGQEYLNQYETHMRLALKAQTQCRATIETLALMKNPQPVTFVRQANVSHGPQQVNNVPQAATQQPSRARESENSPNRLLEQQHGERLEPRTAQAAVGADSALEAVGYINGAKDAGR